MKKLLLLSAAMLVGSQVLAKPAADRLKDFNTMIARQKAGWMDFMKSERDYKTEMKETQRNAMTKFHNEQIDRFMKADLSSQEKKEKFLEQKLDDALKLHKEHMESWEKYSKTHKNKAADLCKKHQEEFNKLEQQIEPAKKTHKRVTSEEAPAHHKKVKHEKAKTHEASMNEMKK